MTVPSQQLIGASVLVGMTIALIWFHVPVVPAVIGALGAGVILYRRAQRRPH